MYLIWFGLEGGMVIVELWDGNCIMEYDRCHCSVLKVHCE